MTFTAKQAKEIAQGLELRRSEAALDATFETIKENSLNGNMSVTVHIDPLYMDYCQKFLDQLGYKTKLTNGAYLLIEWSEA